LSKILIVDDEAHIRLLIAQTLEDLEDEGVELLSAPDGGAALKLIQEQQPALVFLDVMMPVMSGFDVCAAARQDPATKQTYIVLLTAKGQEFDRQRGAQAGADQYLTKPFDPDQLLATAREVLHL
jgi:two-component system alkaline phosphatase synthesis response regulator PhoP